MWGNYAGCIDPCRLLYRYYPVGLSFEETSCEFGKVRLLKNGSKLIEEIIANLKTGQIELLDMVKLFGYWKYSNKGIK